jgi:hypothetical protein
MGQALHIFPLAEVVGTIGFPKRVRLIRFDTND